MTVHCPHCLTGYELPERLLGAGGARVRCPGCQGVFVVLPEDEATVEGEAPVSSEAMSGVASEPMSAPASVSAASPATAAVAAPQEPAEVAASVLAVLTDFLGDALTRSRSRGTVLSDHGPAIIAGWDEYRRRAGEDAPPSAFCAALRDHCGVDLRRRNVN